MLLPRKTTSGRVAHPWKLDRARDRIPHRNPETLAVCLALALVGGLFVAMFGAGTFLTGTRLVGPDGCAAQTWRNPVTGRTEAVGPSRLGRDGKPLCR